MRIHVYANCWNELRMLPFFMRHYEPFVEQFIILDDGSTDGSVEFLQKQPKVSLIAANRRGGSYIEQTRIFFNEAWKQSRSTADWIITCNIDEHLHHRAIEGYLWSCQQDGVTILPANGYEMVSLRFPPNKERLCDHVRSGVPAQKLSGPSSMQDKIMAFNPLAIQEIHFTAGRHQAQPCGNVVYPSQSELALLHYKFIGWDYTVQRYAELKTGLSAADMKSGMGWQYLWEVKTIRRHYVTLVEGASVVVSAGLKRDISLILSFVPIKLALQLMRLLQTVSPRRWLTTWKMPCWPQRHLP